MAGRGRKILGRITIMVTKVKSSKATILLKRFHILCGQASMREEEKRALIRSYGVESSKSLTEKQLSEACQVLAYEQNKRQQEADIWRKRVIAAICSYIDSSSIAGIDNKVYYAKAIAVKAAGAKSFNDIPCHKLQLLYNTFLKRNRLHEEVVQLLSEAELYVQNIKESLGLK